MKHGVANSGVCLIDYYSGGSIKRWWLPAKCCAMVAEFIEFHNHDRSVISAIYTVINNRRHGVVVPPFSQAAILGSILIKLQLLFFKDGRWFVA